MRARRVRRIVVGLCMVRFVSFGIMCKDVSSCLAACSEAVN